MKDEKTQELKQVLIAYGIIAALFIVACHITYLFEQL